MADSEDDLNKEIGFYILHNKNTDETYVGSGVLEDRKRVHFSTLSRGKHHNYKLQRAFNRDPNFDFIPAEVNEVGLSREQNRALALELEQSLINEFKKTPLLLNLAKDVERPRLGVHDSEESRQRKREGQIRRWSNLSDEERESEKSKYRDRMLGNRLSVGRTLTPEAMAKKVASCEGYQHTEETKAKIGQATSIALRGRKLNPDHREKVTAPLLKSSMDKQRSVSIQGTVYAGLNEAARALNLNAGNVHYRLNKDSETYKDWFYVD